LILVAAFSIIIWKSGEWFFGGSRESFGPLHSYVFICLSIAIASLAALNSIYVSSITSDTQRPFLVINNITTLLSRQHDNITFKRSSIYIENKGPLPADKISILVKITEEYGNKVYYVLSPDKIIPVCFPNECIEDIIFRLKDNNISVPRECDLMLKTKIEITYENRLTNKRYRTIMSYHVQNEGGKMIPIPEESYWD